MEEKKAILLVEDEKDYREILKMALSPHFTILEATDGEAGVKMALIEHPDLILFDLQMPIMDGMTAFKEIRKDVWGATVPVFILTNMNATDEKLVQDMVSTKPFHYLVKSNTSLKDVVQKIKDVLAEEE